MSFFEAPTSLRLRQLLSDAAPLVPWTQLRRNVPDSASSSPPIQLPLALITMANTTLDAAVSIAQDHSSHPNFLRLAGLVSEAVLEVVFVALPGFLVAYSGMFDANSQKIVAELNTMVFTPCLIFTKLASQLNAEKLIDLAVIPFIFVAQTLISWVSAMLMARLFGFARKKRQRNFIIAMGVFGNSNSLPISLVLSLSKTISGLHWDQIPGDNDNEVGARGILYLLIFQQLGQLLRWTWGYSVLLKPASAYEEDEREEEAENDRITEEGRYRDESPDRMNGHAEPPKLIDSAFESGASSATSSESSDDDGPDDEIVPPLMPIDSPSSTHGADTLVPRSAVGGLEARSRSVGHITTFPNFSAGSATSPSPSITKSWKASLLRIRQRVSRPFLRLAHAIHTLLAKFFRKLPSPIQKTLSFLHHYHSRFWAGVWRQMNPPLWAMLAALIVASVPNLQHLFFDPGTLVNNSVTRAISQSGGVAVPLILVVLGANLARSTLPQDQLATTPAEKAEERRLLFASLLARMLLPMIVMAPLLALVAKYVPVSILDDPIFIIVCFLLTGAPSALQLAQICQINGVFMGAMSNLLVASYVVAIFPSTLLLVLLALEVVEWAVI